MNAVTMRWNRVSETGLPKTEPNTDTEFIVAVHRRAQNRVDRFAASFLNAKQLYSADEMGDINHDEGTKPVTGWYTLVADDANTDACWWNIIDDGSGDEVVAWMAMPPEPIFFVGAKEHCEFCNDTGKLPGSDYLDCGHCGAVAERAALEDFAYDKFGGLNDPDDRWAIHQRAKTMGRAAALAELHPQWLAKKERADTLELERNAAEKRIVSSTDALKRITLAHHAALIAGNGDAGEIAKLAEYLGLKEKPAPASQPSDLQAAILALEAEKAVQEQHYGEVAAAAACGSALHHGEAACTEGVILGVEYSITRIKELIAQKPQAASHAVVGQQWQPIETAPKDGTYILAVMEGYIPSTVCWRDYCWMTMDMEASYDDGDFEYQGEWKLTHWMPLPPAPQPAHQEGV